MVLENARSWIRDYHVDGLRLDAADQIFDMSPSHILAEVAAVVHREADRLGRPAYVFAETDLNNAHRFLADPSRCGFGHDGHWNDDFHHAAHAVLTGETQRLLRRLRRGRGGRPGQGLRRGLRQQRRLQPLPPAPARRPGDRVPRRPLRRLRPEPRPGGQPPQVRPLRRQPPRLGRPPGRRDPAAGPPAAPAVHGRGVRRDQSLPVLLRLPGPGADRGRPQGRKAEFSYFGWQEEPPDPIVGRHARRGRAELVVGRSAAGGLRRLYRDLLRLRRESPTLRDFRHARTRLLGEAGPPTSWR